MRSLMWTYGAGVLCGIVPTGIAGDGSNIARLFAALVVAIVMTPFVGGLFDDRAATPRSRYIAALAGLLTLWVLSLGADWQ